MEDNYFRSLTDEKLESALSSLIPIRDLARNWDIDIASCLEDYLRELVEITNKADSNFLPSHATNFAQAAILLQNTSSVYSRKVEYLHSLVYSTLTELKTSTEKSKKKEKTKNLTEHQQAIEKFESFDPDMKFLLLDNVLPTVGTKNLYKINLDQEDMNGYHNSFSSVANEKAIATPNDSNLGILENDQTRLSLGGISVTRLERTSEDDNRGLEPYRSSKPKVVLRTLIQEMIEEDNCNEGGISTGTLRLLGGRCVVNETGTLLIQGTSLWGSKIELEETNVDASIESQTIQNGIDEPVHVEDINVGDEDFDNNEETQISLCNNDNDINEAHDIPFDETSGIGFVLTHDDTKIKEENSKAPTKQESPKSQNTLTPDPWLLLDPLSQPKKSISKSTRLRVRKTYRLPPGIKVPPSECVTGASTKSSHVVRMQPNPNTSRPRVAIKSRAGQDQAYSTFERIMNTFKNEDDSANCNFLPSKNGSIEQPIFKPRNQESVLDDEIPLNGLIFGEEFVHISKKNAKHKALEKRKKPSEEPLADSIQINEKAYEGEQEEIFVEDYGDNNSFNDVYDYDNNSSDGDMQEEGNVENIIGGIESKIQNGHFNDIEFEELCRAHIYEFSRGSERYAADSRLSRRINEWQSKLTPILEVERTRNDFDVHQYGIRIIEVMREDMKIKRELRKRKGQKNIDIESKISPPKTVDFQTITENCETHEVCRLFLTSLMLSNSGNISLSHEVEGRSGVVNSKDMLHLELLNETLELPNELYSVN